MQSLGVNIMPGIGIITGLQAAEGVPVSQPVLPNKTPFKTDMPTQPLPPPQPGAISQGTNRIDFTV